MALFLRERQYLVLLHFTSRFPTGKSNCAWHNVRDKGGDGNRGWGEYFDFDFIKHVLVLLPILGNSSPTDLSCWCIYKGFFCLFRNPSRSLPVFSILHLCSKDRT